MKEKFKYYALITHETGGDDEKWAKWLKRRIENYRIPVETVVRLRGDEEEDARRVADATAADAHSVPKRLSVALGESEYTSFSDAARCLIVICSPRGARSGKVREYVKLFVDEKREDYIIPFIIDGAPVGEEERVCYPPALSPAVLGVTLSDGTKEEALIRIISALLGVKYSQLYQRHLIERRRFVVRALAGATALLVAVVALAAWAVSAEISSARRREESDSLARFLLEEMSDKSDSGMPAGIRSMIDKRLSEYYERRGIY